MNDENQLRQNPFAGHTLGIEVVEGRGKERGREGQEGRYGGRGAGGRRGRESGEEVSVAHIIVRHRESSLPPADSLFH